MYDICAFSRASDKVLVTMAYLVVIHAMILNYEMTLRDIEKDTWNLRITGPFQAS